MVIGQPCRGTGPRRSRVGQAFAEDPAWAGSVAAGETPGADAPRDLPALPGPIREGSAVTALDGRRWAAAGRTSGAGRRRVGGDRHSRWTDVHTVDGQAREVT